MPAPRLSKLWWFTGPALFLLLAAVLVQGTLRVPYVVLRPGSARSVEPLVTITSKPGGPEVHQEEAGDNLLFLTVSSVVEPSGFLALRGWLDDKAQVEPSAPFLGTQSADQNRKLNLALMTDSQDKARKVALERLGYDVETKAGGTFLEDVDPDYPAAAVLAPGMTVVGVDGAPVKVRDDLVDAIVAKQPGDPVELEVIPLGSREPQTVTTTLGEREGEPGTAALGVSLVDQVSYTFPVDIDIDTGKVGGPSAGLAFTLAILDRMTPGQLTGGERVALTGTIELDGSVGPVGGVRHKAEAAIRQGATLFLVPPDEYDEAVEAADGRIEVRKVATLDDALEALEDHGGDPLPKAR